MQSSSSSTVALLTLLALALVTLAAGAFLLRRAARGRRLGDTPHCRKCDYPLVGIDSGRCPECGDELGPGAVVRGERRRRPALLAAGLVVSVLGFLAAGFLAPQAYRSVNWYAIKPVGWVIDDAGSATSAVSLRGWAEIERRLRTGQELSKADTRRLAELALAEQAAPTPGPAADRAAAWLGRAVMEGEVDPGQKDRFFRQMVRVNLRTRPKVVLGDRVPFRVEHQGRVPSGGSWWVKLRSEGVSVDGKLVEGPTGTSSGFSGMSAGGSWASTTRCDTPGTHTVSARLRVGVFHGPNASGRDDAVPVYLFELEPSATTEVVPGQPEDHLKVLTDAALGEQIRACLQPQRFEWDGRSIAGEMKVNPLPAGIAFEVSARAGGKEYPMGGMTVPKGGSTNYYLRTQKYDGGAVDEIDLVLRPDAKAARHTVDIDEVWSGALVIEKVPVTRAKQR